MLRKKRPIYTVYLHNQTQEMKTIANFQLSIFVILSLIVYSGHISGQVTIGSGIEPVQGALLDLKEKQTNGTANATKGLMLPRVNLTNPTDIAVGDIAGVTATNKDAHIGLIVYNVREDACAGIPKGVFVWDGSQWQSLYSESGGDNGSLGARVMSVTDTRDGDQYLAGKFGDAGWWFLEGLRYIPTDGSVVLSSSSDINTTKSYFYPEGNPENVYGNPPPTWEPRQGLLYSWAAATNGQNPSTTSNQIQVAGTDPGSEEVESVFEIPSGSGNKNGKIQGLCPCGWHVPSDREWNQLEKEIYQHAEEYSHYTLAERQTFNTAIPWDNAWEIRPAGQYPKMRPEYPPSGDGQGKAMRSQDQVPNGNLPQGMSLSAADGGFSALLTGSCNWPDRGGAIQYGAKFQVWSSSHQSIDYQGNPINSVWFREIEPAGTSGGGVTRDAASPHWLFSVRCKKDN
jgi:uncharacterized protein (TIGR02145 family)